MMVYSLFIGKHKSYPVCPSQQVHHIQPGGPWNISNSTKFHIFHSKVMQSYLLFLCYILDKSLCEQFFPSTHDLYAQTFLKLFLVFFKSTAQTICKHGDSPPHSTSSSQFGDCHLVSLIGEYSWGHLAARPVPGTH